MSDEEKSVLIAKFRKAQKAAKQQKQTQRVMLGEQKKASIAAALCLGDECQKAKQRKQVISEITNVRKTMRRMCVLSLTWPPNVSRFYCKNAAWTRKQLKPNSFAGWVVQMFNDCTLAIVGTVLAILKIAKDDELESLVIGSS